MESLNSNDIRKVSFTVKNCSKFQGHRSKNSEVMMGGGGRGERERDGLKVPKSP